MFCEKSHVSSGVFCPINAINIQGSFRLHREDSYASSIIKYEFRTTKLAFSYGTS